MSSYDLGYQVGQAFGYLLVAGFGVYFFYFRKRSKAKKKENQDDPLDKI